MVKISTKERMGNIPHGTVPGTELARKSILKLYQKRETGLQMLNMKIGMDRYVHVTNESLVNAVQQFSAVYAKAQ